MWTSVASRILQLSGILLPPLFTFIRMSTGQEFSACIEGYYIHNGTCTNCPDKCETCISDSDCITCERNYYGQICQLTCDVRCEGVCHKTHGHCTSGCKDGYYPVAGTPGCLDCPENCQVCSSYEHCILYKDGDSVTRSYRADRHEAVNTSITITAIVISSIVVINLCAAAFFIYRRMNPKRCGANTGTENRGSRRSSHQLPAHEEPVMTDESSLKLLHKPSSSGRSNTESSRV